jgi:hypothetical protein
MSIHCPGCYEHGENYYLTHKCPGCDHEARLASLTAQLQEAQEAMKLVIPCLKDWMNTTGFGETYRRDKAALEAIEAILAKQGGQ